MSTSKLITIFDLENPYEICNQLLKGLNDITNVLIPTKQKQIKKNTSTRKELKELQHKYNQAITDAINSRTDERQSLFRNARHFSDKFMIQVNKDLKLQEEKEMKGKRKRWHILKEMDGNDSKTPTRVIDDGVEVTSLAKIANSMNQF